MARPATSYSKRRPPNRQQLDDKQGRAETRRKVAPNIAAICTANVMHLLQELENQKLERLKMRAGMQQFMEKAQQSTAI